MTTVPCANVRKGGAWCETCWYCLRRTTAWAAERKRQLDETEALVMSVGPEAKKRKGKR